jgi:4-amino-4-deoxy-L-arabinose transferase-like glycosyltransferase
MPPARPATSVVVPVPVPVAGASAPSVPLGVPATVVALTVLRLAILPRLGLFNDEAYYWEWSRHLAAGYFDHPPAVAWVIAASTRLFGTSTAAVHLPALVLSVLSSAALYGLALDLFPRRTRLAWTSVLALNLAPLFAVGAVFTTPDAPMTLLWLWTARLVWHAVHGRPWLWYVAGVTGGLGLLSKYNFVLLPASILAFLLTGGGGHWLRRREPWIAAAIMLVVFAPNLLWNVAHGLESFRFQLVDRHDAAFRPWRTVGRYLTAQQSLSPLLWMACLAGLVRAVRRARAGSEPHAYLVALSAVSLAFFGVASLFTYVNPNWFGVGFLGLLVAGSEVLLALRSRALRAAALGLAAAVTLLFYVQALTLALPVPRTDFFADLQGWPQVGERLRALATSAPGAPPRFVFSRRLQLSAMAAFYTGGGLDVTRLGGRPDAYDAWAPRGARRGQDAVYLCDDQRYALPDAPFRACTPAGDLPIVRAGRTIRTFHFWQCSGYTP